MTPTETHVQRRTRRRGSSATLEAEIARLKDQESQMHALLKVFVPQPLEYSCSVPGVEMAGWSLAPNDCRGADLSYPIVFEAPQDVGRCFLSPTPEKSHGIKSGIEKGISSLGLFMADPMGHHSVNAIPAAMLSLAARVGLEYELRENGRVSTNFARIINDKFYFGSPSEHPISLLLMRFAPDPDYSGLVKGSYIALGAPPPVILRKDSDRFEHFDLKKVRIAPALGLFPTKEFYEDFLPNEFTLYPGDIMLPYSDGLSNLGTDKDLPGGYIPYFPPQGSSLENRAERLLVSMRNESALTISRELRMDIMAHRIPPREDDVSAYIVKAKPFSEN